MVFTTIAFRATIPTTIIEITEAERIQNAMVVNTTYRMESAQQALDDLQERKASLIIDVATLSAPSHIEEWAKSQWMVRPNPQNVVVLKVPGAGADR